MSQQACMEIGTQTDGPTGLEATQADGPTVSEAGPQTEVLEAGPQTEHQLLRYLPPDEQLAALGLSAKLFWWQIPELLIGCNVMEDLRTLEVARPIEEQARMLTRAAMLCRGVRGHEGVRSIGGLFVSDAGRKLLGEHRGTGAAWFRKAGARLKQWFTNETKQRGEENYTWCGHAEGHHAHGSGMHFVDAVQTSGGSASIAEVYDDMFEVVQLILNTRGERALPEESLLKLLQAGVKRFPLQLGTEEGTAKTMGQYNAMDFGRWVVCWGESAGHIQTSSMSEEVFQKVMGSQQEHAKAFACKLGISSSCQFNAKMISLARVGRSILPAPAGMNPERGVNWCTVAVHICEMAQVFRKWPGTQDFEALTRDPISSSLKAVASKKLVEIHQHTGYRRQCHTELLVRAVLEHVLQLSTGPTVGGSDPATPVIAPTVGGSDPTTLVIAEKSKHKGKGEKAGKSKRKGKGKKTVDPSKAGESKASTSAGKKADKAKGEKTEAPPKVGKRKGNDKDPLKSQSICPRCKAVVRRDVMARHQATDRCKQTASA